MRLYMMHSNNNIYIYSQTNALSIIKISVIKKTELEQRMDIRRLKPPVPIRSPLQSNGESCHVHIYIRSGCGCIRWTGPQN